MSAQHRELRPASMAPPAANYAHAIATDGATRWVHTSGVVPVAPDGSVPSELVDQARVVWSNIAAILREAGLGPDDVVSVTTYVVADRATSDSLGDSLGAVMAARDEFLGGRRAASTLVTVPALARSEWSIEIAVIAAS